MSSSLIDACNTNENEGKVLRRTRRRSPLKGAGKHVSWSQDASQVLPALRPAKRPGDAPRPRRGICFLVEARTQFLATGMPQASFRRDHPLETDAPGRAPQVVGNGELSGHPSGALGTATRAGGDAREARLRSAAWCGRLGPAPHVGGERP